jgi:hypothetical protein
MYRLLSASTTELPRPEAMNSGAPPTAFQARTGLFTPPGIFFTARRKSFLE